MIVFFNICYYCFVRLLSLIYFCRFVLLCSVVKLVISRGFVTSGWEHCPFGRHRRHGARRNHQLCPQGVRHCRCWGPCWHNDVYSDLMCLCSILARLLLVFPSTHQTQAWWMGLGAPLGVVQQSVPRSSLRRGSHLVILPYICLLFVS